MNFDEKAPVLEAVETLKKSLESGDTDKIKADSEALTQKFYAISEKLYQQAQAAADVQGQGTDPAGFQGDNVVDADYEDVD